MPETQPVVSLKAFDVPIHPVGTAYGLSLSKGETVNKPSGIWKVGFRQGVSCKFEELGSS